MTEWLRDIAKAPRGKWRVEARRTKKGEAIHEVFEPAYVWLASDCGIVTKSYWIHDAPSKTEKRQPERWCMFCTGQKPVAWRPYIDGEFDRVEVVNGREMVRRGKPEYPVLENAK